MCLHVDAATSAGCTNGCGTGRSAIACSVRRLCVISRAGSREWERCQRCSRDCRSQRPVHKEARIAEKDRSPGLRGDCRLSERLVSVQTGLLWEDLYFLLRFRLAIHGLLGPKYGLPRFLGMYWRKPSSRGTPSKRHVRAIVSSEGLRSSDSQLYTVVRLVPIFWLNCSVVRPTFLRSGGSQFPMLL